MIAVILPPPDGYCPVCQGYVVTDTATAARAPGTGDCFCVMSVLRMFPPEPETEPPEPADKNDEPWRKENRHKYDFANGKKGRRR